MRAKSLWMPFLVLLAAALVGPVEPARVQAAARAQTSGLVPLAPAACPASGCAAGQRLSYRLDFEIGAYAASTAPNVKVCVYIPASWQDAVQFDTTGGITGAAYASSGNCSEDSLAPSGYALAGDRQASFSENFFNDTLNLSLRIAPTATAPGSLLLRVFERTASGWVRTTQVYTPQMQVAARAATAYVAGDAASCSAAPCYLNSAGDGPDGLGTGLKDAVDALDASQPDLRVIVLGTVGLKGSTVLIDKPLTLQGSGDASLTTITGAVCASSAPMLRFTAGGTLRGLTINDGVCSGSSDRPLVEINSPTAMTIESNDLVFGSNAIRVTGGGTSNVTARYNHISGNSGYALLWDNTSSATLDMIANNLGGNRAGAEVECASPSGRRVDHNYWGSGTPSASNCTVSSGKQLGAPVMQLSNAPGLDARLVTVTGSKTYAFDNQIAYARSGGSDFPLYIVNHGASFPTSLPFADAATAPNPCSNAWDIFLAGGAPADSVLELSFRYNRSSACIAAVESSSYCEQTASPQNYPLWWYDPAGSVTAGWDTTGQSPAGSGAGGAGGQSTSCDLDLHEIKVNVDNSGRPSLGSDLNFTPFLVGVPVPTTFQAFASNQTITLVWTTASEPDIAGFTVLRSLSQDGAFEPVSDLIARVGSATGGATYSFADGGRTNGVTNYYRLRVTRSDGTTFLSTIVSIVPNVATVTPTRTITPTLTPRPTFTPYRFPTSIIIQPTRIPTSTRVLATSARTATETATSGLGTAFPTSAYPGPGELLTATEDLNPAAGEVSGTPPPSSTASLYPGTPTVTLTPTRTAAPTLSLPAQIRGASRFVSLVLGLLTSGAVISGLTWLMFRRRKDEEQE